MILFGCFLLFFVETSRATLTALDDDEDDKDDATVDDDKEEDDDEYSYRFTSLLFRGFILERWLLFFPSSFAMSMVRLLLLLTL